MSNAVGTLVRPQLDRSTGTLGLALGDLVVLAGFLTLGSMNHGVDPATMTGRVAGTVAPFLIGWVVAAPLVGAYAPDATRTVGTAAVRASLAWIPAAAIGLALRSTDFFHGGSPWTFALVVTGVGLASFVAWRAAAAVLR
ncbi:DUF3054 domain-containing protein [Halorussus salilacus]|uniref:DUF3054 domain-containing protein n=1 Tax=Halorussus salilacus TaxID=2953750 RepID=UPI00209DEDEF|nr:DUF3054 domain-containing protein [Halorussus salilacus]USZ68592.1 DUF3054 domain-containing protein [Halorussus salilacus]